MQINQIFWPSFQGVNNIELGLDSVLAFAGQVGHPERYLKNVIHVAGQVMNPSSFTLESGLPAISYLEKAGIDEKYAESFYYIIAPNGIVSKHPLRVSLKNNLFTLTRSDPLLYPGSVIYVPTSFESLQDIEFAATIAPIFSSLALSLASLNTLSN